jgi:hypothetical protein
VQNTRSSRSPWISTTVCSCCESVASADVPVRIGSHYSVDSTSCRETGAKVLVQVQQEKLRQPWLAAVSQVLRTNKVIAADPLQELQQGGMTSNEGTRCAGQRRRRSTASLH